MPPTCPTRYGRIPQTEEDAANYLTLVQEENNPAEMTRALEKIYQASATKRSFAGCAEQHAH